MPICHRWHPAIFAVGLVACAKSDQPAPAAIQVDTAGVEWARMGLIFDPRLLKSGDRVGELTVMKVSARAAADSSVLGTVHFDGEIRLSGHTFRHPEFPDVRSVCFEADSASAQRMPRWSGDNRRAWFCLDNSEAAASSLALPGDVRPAEVVIESFVIHRGASDEVNSAKLRRVVSRGNVTQSPYAPRAAAVSPSDAERAAKEIVSFLRGDAPFNADLFADSVTLYVSPEGGSGSKQLSRDQLRTKSSWTVASISRHSFIPQAQLRNLTAKFGVHFNCHEYPLATRNPSLARLPHVGVKLVGSNAGSCLQSWNVTMVFSDSTLRPVLVAALYDQWEW